MQEIVLPQDNMKMYEKLKKVAVSGAACFTLNLALFLQQRCIPSYTGALPLHGVDLPEPIVRGSHEPPTGWFSRQFLVEDGPHCIGKYPLVIDQSMKREWFFSMNVCGNFHCHIGLLESTWTSFKKGAWQPICLLCKVTMEHKHLTIPAPVGILTEQYFRDPLHRRVDFDSHQGPNDRPLFVFI